MRSTVVLLCAVLAACAGNPETTVRVQGTVQTVGLKTPVSGAEVNVEWPARLGGGQSVLKTNAQGQFAVGRTRRIPKTACAGLAITVQAPNFASAYTRHAGDCGDGVLTFDFSLLPQIR
jgi:hypothetical protein